MKKKDKTISLLTTILAVLCIGIAVFGCSKNKQRAEDSIAANLEDVPESGWKSIKENTILFGHRSVGNNIISGVGDLGRSFEIVDIDVENIDEKRGRRIRNALLHLNIGQNRNPESKLKAFSETMDSGLGKDVDIALMKFCYVDFNMESDYRMVFQQYQNTIQRLQRRYPATTFVHVTVPLVSKERGIKPFIKKIIGRPVRDASDNVVREGYNDLVRHSYSGKEPVFDLALIESTRPDGTRTLIEYNGKPVPELNPHYTYDGGHLNETGRQFVASYLVRLLADIAQDR